MNSLFSRCAPQVPDSKLWWIRYVNDVENLRSDVDNLNINFFNFLFCSPLTTQDTPQENFYHTEGKVNWNLDACAFFVKFNF